MDQAQKYTELSRLLSAIESEGEAYALSDYSGEYATHDTAFADLLGAYEAANARVVKHLKDATLRMIEDGYDKELLPGFVREEWL